jgi:hypothetical protein
MPLYESLQQQATRAQRKAYEQGLQAGYEDVLENLIAEGESIYDEASGETVEIVRVSRLREVRAAAIESAKKDARA